MIATLERSLRAILIVVGTAVLWLAMFNFNMWLFAHTAFPAPAHWISLPAAFRVPSLYHNIDTQADRTGTSQRNLPLSH
jgi:hypothetical protein